MVSLSQNIYENSIEGLNCIWEGSNIIGQKLCKRNFDCENCPMDKILKNIYPEEGKGKNLQVNDVAFLDDIIHKIEETTFDPRLIYLKNNLVAKNIYANIFYLGLNPLLTNLLENISGVKEYMKRVYFIKDNEVIAIKGGWGTFTLKTSINFLLLDKLNWAPEEILSNKWIALAAINQFEITDAKLSSGHLKIQQAKILNLLSEYRENCLCINTDINDNAEKVKYLYQLTGGNEYIDILNNKYLDY